MFPAHVFKTHVIVELIHRNMELNVTLHYDQGYVDPQTPTSDDGVCALPDGDVAIVDGQIISAEPSALGAFVQRHAPETQSNAE